MALSVQDYDEAASDCNRWRIRQLFAATAGDQISADDRGIPCE